MKKQKPVISIFTTIWGHGSIGEAVRDSLDSKKYKIYYNFIKPDVISRKSYEIPYLLFPAFNKIPYKMAESEYISNTAKKYLYKTYSKKIEYFIESQKPDVVINTYFAFNFTLEKLHKRYPFLPINIVADPRSFHKIVTSQEFYNFVFDKDAVNKCRKFGVNPEKIIQSGWFVRKRFEKVKDIKKVRKSLGVNPDLLTLSIIGGSEGTLNVLKILPAFIHSTKNLQIVFICGKNKGLYESLKAFIKILNLNKERNVNIYAKGYTSDTYKYLQASDLVIGKAGPNLLFETVATQTPFLAVSHMAGQEDGNLEIIKRYRLGFVEENPVRALFLIRKIISKPHILKRFDKPLQWLNVYNQRSASVLQEFIEKKSEKEIQIPA